MVCRRWRSGITPGLSGRGRIRMISVWVGMCWPCCVSGVHISGGFSGWQHHYPYPYTHRDFTVSIPETETPRRAGPERPHKRPRLLPGFFVVSGWWSDRCLTRRPFLAAFLGRISTQVTDLTADTPSGCGSSVVCVLGCPHHMVLAGRPGGGGLKPGLALPARAGPSALGKPASTGCRIHTPRPGVVPSPWSAGGST